MSDPVSFDWDNCLVDENQEWLEGAKEALRLAERKRGAFIHSCRANYAAGEALIRQKLDESGFRNIDIYGKPSASVYIDDLGLRFDGDWESLKPFLR